MMNHEIDETNIWREKATGRRIHGYCSKQLFAGVFFNP